MTLKSGMGASLGIAAEVTWGVPVAPTIHLPFLEESLTAEPERVESEGIIAGQRVLRSQQWSPGRNTVGGDVGLELTDRSMSLLFEHMFGTVTGSGPYTFTPGDLTGKGLTFQRGVPDTTTGAVHPVTTSGGKIASWELGLAEGEIVTLGLTVIGRHEIRHRTVTDGVTTNASAAITSATAVFSQDDVGKPISGTGIPAATTLLSVTSATAATLSANATATGSGVTFTLGLALTSPSYAASIAPFTFIGSTVTVAGSSYKVKNLTLSGDNGLAERRFANGGGHTDEPLENGLREYAAAIDTEFFNDDVYDRVVRGTEVALVVNLAKGSSTCQITANVRSDAPGPNVAGRGIVEQSVTLKAVGPTTDAGAITAVLSAA